jgi:hypothetical protein
MASLTYLGLDRNKLSGSLPNTPGRPTNLDELIIWGNGFSAPLPDLSALTDMKTLSAPSCSPGGRRRGRRRRTAAASGCRLKTTRRREKGTPSRRGRSYFLFPPNLTVNRKAKIDTTVVCC